jgi:hypothetical protein
MTKISTPVPSFIHGRERAAIQELDRDASDGVITRREAQCFANRNRDLFEHGDHRYLKSSARALVGPGTT